jgi:haloacetate dehalogenase
MFEGFESSMIDAGVAEIRVRHGGSGPPLLLLHGNPQTHAMWHETVPRLAGEFTVVATDLRGYGDSSKPETTPDHAPYSKRAMAEDQVAVMRSLGFERFFVCGHDRGARVAYRMALDHPERVLKLAVLDIVPTWEAFSRADMAFGLGYWHWFFLAQPYDLPERLIGADPDFFLLRTGRPDVWTQEAIKEYRQAAGAERAKIDWNLHSHWILPTLLRTLRSSVSSALALAWTAAQTSWPRIAPSGNSAL